MLPDFPEAQKFAEECLLRILYNRIAFKTGWMQAMGPPVPIHEGTKVVLHRYDGSIDDVPMKRSGAVMKIKCDDLEKKGLPAVLDGMEQVANEMSKQHSKYFIERIDEITKESGQVYNNQGLPLTVDTILDSLDKIEMDFDEQGHPLMPTIMAGPSMVEKIKNLKPTDEQNKRYNEILERKYSEWRDRESNRRLVD